MSAETKAPERRQRDTASMDGRRERVARRFWPKVDVRGEDECWEWRGSTRQNGYGRIKVGGRWRKAHRVSVWLDGGDPMGLMVLHRCDNPPCVNPRHLYLGTNGDNLRDAYARGLRTPLGERHANAKLTAGDVVDIRRLLAQGLSQQAIADRYGVAQPSISKIALGLTWRHVP